MRHNLIKYRSSRSQGEMAQKHNVTQQAWSNWENGYDTPRPTTMLQISKDAGMSIETLFFEENNNEKLSKALSPTGTEK